MKLVAFLLSIYIFALNVAPCADEVVNFNDATTDISQATDDGHQHQESDLCTPFCICQCCHINTTFFQFSSFRLDVAFISTQDFLYLNGLEKDFTTSILQPPRV